MTYWQNMHVHTQLFFSPLQTSQFLSFAATILPAELMSHQVVLARVNKRKKIKKSHKHRLRKYLQFMQKAI